MKSSFHDTYLGKLRLKVGSELLQVPGFRIVIEDQEGRILLIKRTDNKKWALPAGSPELGESIQDCIRREVKEETGLHLKTFSVFGYASDPRSEVNTYPNGDKTHSFVLLVFSREFDGNPNVSDDETSEVRFFNFNEFPNSDECVTHEIKSVLRYQEFKKSNQFQWS